MASPEELSKGHDGRVPTMKVKIKGLEVTINESDYDPKVHTKLDEKGGQDGGKESGKESDKEKVK